MKLAPVPTGGVVRVSPSPTLLPPRPRAGEPGRNRYDDPDGWFVVRYGASTLRGCLVELMAQFRFDPQARRRVAGITGVHEPEDESSLAHAVGDWLAAQRVAVCHLEAAAEVVSVNDPNLLASLNHHPRVRSVLDESNLGGDDHSAELDGGTVRLPGPVGRRITQAVSRALYDRNPRPDGLAYTSRLDDAETCWAIYGHAAVRFEPYLQQLRPEAPDHRAAVRSAADLHGLPLPDRWR